MYLVAYSLSSFLIFLAKTPANFKHFFLFKKINKSKAICSSWLPEGNPTVRTTYLHARHRAAHRATHSQWFKSFTCLLKYFPKDRSLMSPGAHGGVSYLAALGGSPKEPCSRLCRWGVSTSPLCSRQVFSCRTGKLCWRGKMWLVLQHTLTPASRGTGFSFTPQAPWFCPLQLQWGRSLRQ